MFEGCHHAGIQAGVLLFGIQGENEAGTHIEGEGEMLSLAGQRLAEFQALVCHDKVFTF